MTIISIIITNRDHSPSLGSEEPNQKTLHQSQIWPTNRPNSSSATSPSKTSCKLPTYVSLSFPKTELLQNPTFRHVSPRRLAEQQQNHRSYYSGRLAECAFDSSMGMAIVDLQHLQVVRSDTLEQPLLAPDGLR